MLDNPSSREVQTTDCRLLVDLPLPGAWNMAVDEVLLDWSAEMGRCAWRFYQWEEPTLSLGYFQPEADRRSHHASARCPVVRRLTGGGAILHDNELTYSVVVPAGHPLGQARDRLYEAVHGSLIEVLSGRQLTAALRGQGAPSSAADEPFLCFARRTPGDVLMAGVKIAGSAQRRRRGAVLQHGSVLLGLSEAAPEICPPPGMCQATLSPGQLAEAWLPVLARRLGFQFQPQGLCEPERRRAEQLVRDRYAREDWTVGRRRV
jgi:lipoate-protein ligase A